MQYECCDTATAEPPPKPARFPAEAVVTLAALILVHLAIVAWSTWSWVDQGGLRRGATAVQPWRLITSLFLHADYGHALRNGLALLVFGVPLLAHLGRVRSALVYFAAGIGGGLTALALAEVGTTVIGSSGAVAGLFGAWVVLGLHRARLDDLPGRARIRTLGVALLVLPSLIAPISPSGHRISVSSHLGGAATGMVVGALLSRGWLRRSDEPAAADVQTETAE